MPAVIASMSLPIIRTIDLTIPSPAPAVLAANHSAEGVGHK
jgi:hypothetical protein